MTDSMMPEIDRARVLLAEIGWDDVQIASAPGGTVNRTYRLTRDDAAWYLRIGPTDAEAEAGPGWFSSMGLQREQRAIALWSGLADFLPTTVHTDFSRSHIDADWVIQEEMPGESWYALRSRLSNNQSQLLWQQFGQLVAQLHSYTAAEFGPPDPGIGYSYWSGLCRWDATGLLTDARKYELPLEPFTNLCELVDKHTHELDEIQTPRLIHSDLGMRHVLIDM